MDEPRQYLVVDTSVAIAAAKAANAYNPEGCLSFLQMLLVHKRIRLVMAAKDTWPASANEPAQEREIDGTWEEWQRHIAELDEATAEQYALPNPFRVWWISIVGRVEWPSDDAVNVTARQQIATAKQEVIEYILKHLRGNKLRAYGKDFHLIKGAMLRDATIVSVDIEARELYATAAPHTTDLRDIAWVHLKKPRKLKYQQAWMMNPAEAEAWLIEMEQAAAIKADMKLG